MDMKDRTIDLTVPIPPQLRVLLVILGIVHIVGGALFLSTGHGFFGILNLVLGPSWLSWGLFYDRINRHAVEIQEGHVRITRGLFRGRRIPWDSISGIRLAATGMEIRVSGGRGTTVNFGGMSHAANQAIRTEFVNKLLPVAGSKGIPVVED